MANKANRDVFQKVLSFSILHIEALRFKVVSSSSLSSSSLSRFLSLSLAQYNKHIINRSKQNKKQR